jgi:hypothetical protein
MRPSSSAIAVLATALVLAFAPAALAQSSPTKDAYGGVIAEVVTPNKAPSTSSKPPASNAVTPAAAAAPSNGSLPFTGLQVGVILFAGAALLGVGLVLRRFSSSS